MTTATIYGYSQLWNDSHVRKWRRHWQEHRK